MDANETIRLVAAIVTPVWALLRFLPRALYLFNPALTAVRFEEAAGNPLDEQSAKVKELAAWLDHAGFSRLGVKCEHIPLVKRPIRSAAYASSEYLCFASVLLDVPKFAWYFYTPFEDGSVVLTANGHFRNRVRPGCRITVSHDTDPETVLGEHGRHVQEFIDAGHNPFNEFTPETRVQATTLFYAHPAVRNHLRMQGALAATIIAAVFVVSIDLLVSVLQ